MRCATKGLRGGMVATYMHGIVLLRLTYVPRLLEPSGTAENSPTGGCWDGFVLSLGGIAKCNKGS